MEENNLPQPLTEMIGKIHDMGVKHFGLEWLRANEDAVATFQKYAERFNRDKFAKFKISDPIIKEMVPLLVLRAMYFGRGRKPAKPEPEKGT